MALNCSEFGKLGRDTGAFERLEVQTMRRAIQVANLVRRRRVVGVGRVNELADCEVDEAQPSRIQLR
jgi:hypothetical protein